MHTTVDTLIPKTVILGELCTLFLQLFLFALQNIKRLSLDNLNNANLVMTLFFNQYICNIWYNLYSACCTIISNQSCGLCTFRQSLLLCEHAIVSLIKNSAESSRHFLNQDLCTYS